jgi:hypothetical protein
MVAGALYDIRARAISPEGVTSAWTNTTHTVTAPLGPYTPTYVELQEGYTSGNGTKTPTVPTISTCKAVGTKAILIEWDRQLNLTNLDHYEIQVSDDNSTWYSLQFDGSDWKGTVDEDTDTDVERLIHTNIPHTGDADNPSGRTLYYRVRRVTKAAAASSWSTSASATTNTVGAGDLAGNSVYANNIIANVLEALFAKIAYALTIGFGGTGDKDNPDTGDRRVYIDDDELAIQKYDGSSWGDRIRLGYQKLQAKDENGVIIHDIPDEAIQTDQIYGGHVIWDEAPNYLERDEYGIETEMTGFAPSVDVNNTDISAYIPGSLSNVKGALCFFDIRLWIDAVKVTAGTHAHCMIRYGHTYDQCTQYGKMLNVGVEISNGDLDNYGGAAAFLPVVYHNSTPYIVWAAPCAFLDMTSSLGWCTRKADIYLLGFLV